MIKDTKKCRKCGQPIVKTKIPVKDICLEDYTPSTMLCASCNATTSVIKRINSNIPIRKDELRRLPKTLVFDSTGASVLEKIAANKFRKIVERYCAQE